MNRQRLNEECITWDETNKNRVDDSSKETANDLCHRLWDRHPLLLDLIHYSTFINQFLPTTLNKMMATASFTIPYPKIIEKILGNYEALMRVRAATESVALMVALYLTMREISSY